MVACELSASTDHDKPSNYKLFKLILKTRVNSEHKIISNASSPLLEHFHKKGLVVLPCKDVKGEVMSLLKHLFHCLTSHLKTHNTVAGFKNYILIKC